MLAERRNALPYFLHQVAENALEKKRHQTLIRSTNFHNLNLALHDFHQDPQGVEKFIRALPKPRAKVLNRTVPIFRKSVLWKNLGSDVMRLYRAGAESLWNELSDLQIYDILTGLGLHLNTRDLMHREIGQPSRMTRNGMIQAIRCKLRNPDSQEA